MLLRNKVAGDTFVMSALFDKNYKGSAHVLIHLSKRQHNHMKNNTMHLRELVDESGSPQFKSVIYGVNFTSRFGGKK